MLIFNQYRVTIIVYRRPIYNYYDTTLLQYAKFIICQNWSQLIFIIFHVCTKISLTYYQTQHPDISSVQRSIVRKDNKLPSPEVSSEYQTSSRIPIGCLSSKTALSEVFQHSIGSGRHNKPSGQIRDKITTRHLRLMFWFYFGGVGKSRVINPPRC